MITQEQNTLPSSVPFLGKRLPRGKPLPPYAVEYFNQLVAHYLSLGLADTDPALSLNRNAQGVADAIIREQDKNRLNWGDLSGLEMALLQLMPEANLQRLAWSLRARYSEIAGPSWLTLYEQSCPPPICAPAAPPSLGAASGADLLSGLKAEPSASPVPSPGAGPAAPPGSLRADLTVLLSELQRLRAVTQVREEQRARIAARAAIGAFGLMSLAILLFFLFPNRVGPVVGSEASAPAVAQPQVATVPSGGAAPVILVADAAPKKDPPGPPSTSGPVGAIAPPAADRASRPARLPHDWQIVCFVVATGAIGGLISMLRRIQAASGAGIAQVDTIALDAGEVSVTLSPLYGAVFALVLYLVFMGGLLDAKIDGMSIFPTFDPGTGLMSAYGDFAKLMVWSFIAGFAEKFVPDVLDRLTIRNQAVKQAAAK